MQDVQADLPELDAPGLFLRNGAHETTILCSSANLLAPGELQLTHYPLDPQHQHPSRPLIHPGIPPRTSFPTTPQDHIQLANTSITPVQLIQ